MTEAGTKPRDARGRGRSSVTRRVEGRIPSPGLRPVIDRLILSSVRVGGVFVDHVESYLEEGGGMVLIGKVVRVPIVTRISTGQVPSFYYDVVLTEPPDLAGRDELHRALAKLEGKTVILSVRELVSSESP